jgi:hypothetical protein
MAGRLIDWIILRTLAAKAPKPENQREKKGRAKARPHIQEITRRLRLQPQASITNPAAPSLATR